MQETIKKYVNYMVGYIRKQIEGNKCWNSPTEQDIPDFVIK